MGDRFNPDAAVPFPRSFVSDKAPSPDFHASDVKDVFPARASATNMMAQKSGFHVAAQRPHSLRWLDDPESSTPVRFPSIASATTVTSSLHRADDTCSTRGDTAPACEYETVFAPDIHYNHRMSNQHVPSLAASQRSVLRLVARPFSKKRSADLPSLHSAASLPSSPVTPNTPLFASSPTIADFSTSPFLDAGLYSEVPQDAFKAGGPSNLGGSSHRDKPNATSRLRRQSRDLRPVLDQSIPFDPTADLTLQQLQRAQDLHVLDHDGTKIRFGDLWQTQSTCFIFIRHFWCPLCMDYMRSITEQAEPEKLHKASVGLVVISNGSPAMIKSYSSIFSFPFPVYTDPSRALYHALGMTLRTNDGGPDSERGDYVEHGVASGIAMVMKNAVKARMPLHKNRGDIKQLGGEFVLGPGLRCSYVSRMHNTRSHAPVRDVLSAAGVQLDEAQPQVSFDGEEQWMKAREADLKRIRARKGRRRGFVGEFRSSESSEFDRGSMEVSPVPHHGDDVKALGYIKEYSDNSETS